MKRFVLDCSVRKYHLAAYDAAYLELAIRLSIPLATNDQRLMDAAQQANVFLAQVASNQSTQEPKP